MMSADIRVKNRRIYEELLDRRDNALVAERGYSGTDGTMAAQMHGQAQAFEEAASLLRTDAEKLVDLASDIESIDKHEWTEEELDTRYPGPGKLEGETIRSAILYEYALNGFADKEVYFDGEPGEEYSFFDGVEINGVGPVYASLWESDTGFVHTKFYQSHDELEADYKRLEKEAADESHRAGDDF